SFTPQMEWPEGQHTIRAVAHKGNKISQPATRTFLEAKMIPNKKSVDHFTVDQDQHDPFKAKPNAKFDKVPTVYARDANDDGVAGVPVIFKIKNATSDGPLFDGKHSDVWVRQTDAQGKAVADVIDTGADTGTYTIEVTTTGSSASHAFTLIVGDK
ncbi:hypothetical protein, partial [Streptomyces sp. NPDC002559]